MIDAKKFIGKYEKYYFKDQFEPKPYLKIRKNNTTVRTDEEKIVSKLKEGIHDSDVIAWKLGSYKSEKTITDSNISGAFCSYDLSDYLNNIKKQKEEIKEIIDSISNNNNYYNNIIYLTKLFDILKKCRNNVKNNNDRFGTVYLINSMFFLSKGLIPIYDKNVYRAVQALYLKKNPESLVVSDAPKATDGMGAMFRLVDYMWLINEVFGDTKTEMSEEYNKCEHVGYISRGLDRALWVYGQCTEEYKQII